MDDEAANNKALPKIHQQVNIIKLLLERQRNTIERQLLPQKNSTILDKSN